MKKTFSKTVLALAAASMILAGCGKPLTVVHDNNGKVSEKTYPTYGFLNMESSRSTNMCYELSVGNVIWSVLLSGSILFPVYFIGFSIYNPVGPKVNGQCPGIDG